MFRKNGVRYFLNNESDMLFIRKMVFGNYLELNLLVLKNIY